MALLSLEPQGTGDWVPVDNGATSGQTYRLCANYTDHGVCNWAIPADAPDALCTACGLTHTIPDLTVAGNGEAWLKLERAKRRLVFDLLSLQLPLVGKRENPTQGVEFQFLTDGVKVNADRSRVLTGHDNGLITINVAEADDVYREAQRQLYREPYRTLLGHFRHEIGHYYWDRLIQSTARLPVFRQLFGDEQVDYQTALRVHYEDGPPADWATHYITAYASTHPWEDWAESWAHVMLMVDALETAHEVGLSVRPGRSEDPGFNGSDKPAPGLAAHFDQLVDEWYSLSYVLNNLTRGLGLPDAYPFVLSDPVIEKLRFVRDVMVNSRSIVAAQEPARAAA